MGTSPCPCPPSPEAEMGTKRRIAWVIFSRGGCEKVFHRAADGQDGGQCGAPQVLGSILAG